MKKKKFTVHKYIVQNNRMGFELWASQNNKSHIYDSISKEWVNLDDFSGDRIPLELVSNEYKKILCTRQISQNPYPIRVLPS